MFIVFLNVIHHDIHSCFVYRKKRKRAPLLFSFQKDCPKSVTSCVEGCEMRGSGTEHGVIRCCHCTMWFHLRCVGLEKAPRKKWYHSSKCAEAGECIIIPDNDQFEEWKNSQLQAALFHFDLPKSGKKKKMAARLKKRKDSGLETWDSGPMKPFNFTFHSRQGPTLAAECSADSSLEWMELFGIRRSGT